MTNFYELKPHYTNQKSFYGKAIIVIKGNTSTLYSYDTKVAQVVSGETKSQDKAIVFGTYSPTTLKHIKEFLKQFGFKAEKKSQIEKDYMEVV